MSMRKTLAALASVVLLSAVMGSATSSPALATGESWSPITPPAANNWSSVAYGNGVWVAVGLGTNQVMRSSDGGVTWTTVTGPQTADWSSVAYGNGVWVAVARTGTNRVMRSTDGGVTWTAVTVELLAWSSVAYGNGVWVAVALGTNELMGSINGGQTWSREGGAGEANLWSSVAYGDGGGGPVTTVWVAVSSNGTNRLMRSTTGGVTWTAVGSSGGVGALDWRSVAYGNGVWVAVAHNASQVMRSLDSGQTWSTSSVGVEASSWRSVAYGGGVWVAVADGGTNRVMRSTDGGETWTSLGSAAGVEANSWMSVAHGAGTWVAVAMSGTPLVMRSVTPASSGAGASESPGAPGIFLHIAGTPGRLVEGTPVYHGSVGVAPNTSYTLSVQSMDARALTRTVLVTGVTGGRGHVEGRIQLSALAPGSYKIVMTGTHRFGNSLVLTNHIRVDAAGKFVSVSPESMQPTLR